MRFLFPLLVLLLTIFAIAPLGYPGGFQSHSGLLATYNLIDLDANPLQFFNWSPIVGHSFDFLRGEGALPYWLALILHRVGFGYLDSLKLVYALAWIASGLAMFALARRHWDDAGALVAATVYVYLPYHIATVYVRGAFAESVAWALFPLALSAVVGQDDRQQTTDNRLFATLAPHASAGVRNPQFVSFAFCVLTFALLFLTQPGLAIIFALFAVAIALALNWRARNFAGLTPLVGIFAGLLLSIPTLLRYGFALSRDGFSPTYVLPFQLFSALWGYGVSTGSFLDQFPFQLGVVPLGFAIVAAAFAWRQDESANGGKRVAIIFLVAAVVLILLTFEIAAPLWSVLGFLASAPWALLALVGFALAFVAGAIVKSDEHFAQFPMLAFLVALPVVASYGYLLPRFVDVNPTRPHIAIFGNNEIALLDYKILGPLRHGATVRVQTMWQALHAPDNDYTVFLHAVHEDGKTYGETDRKPLDGELPTLKWTPGQVISDTHPIQIDVEGPTEGYHLEFGLYNAATGRRARLSDGSDHLNLPRPGDPPPFIPTR